ncbi:hypothetical protein [Nonomuraea fuscirosea]|uniref:hypothetical protein n=1 Tax=Nonomuraea fuscirosea TaxID=1291556 RepID=UPI00342ED25B
MVSVRGAGAVIVLLAVLLVTGSVAAGDDPRLPLAEVGWRAAWSLAVDPVMTPHDDTPIAAVSAHGLVVATRQRTVEIRDPRTGAVRRVVAAPREPTGLGAAAGMLVIATKAPSPAHPSLHGYKLADGEHVWKQTITDAVKNEGPPIMVTEHAVVVVGREKKGTVPVRSIDVRADARPRGPSRRLPAVLPRRHDAVDRVRRAMPGRRTCHGNGPEHVAAGLDAPADVAAQAGW